MKKIWVVEKMDYKDEETGRYVWGVHNSNVEGYGYDTFDTQEEARDYAREMNEAEYQEVYEWDGNKLVRV